jgi:hypothetical protein
MDELPQELVDGIYAKQNKVRDHEKPSFEPPNRYIL